IVAALTPAIQAAKQATSDIPIVMAPAGEPVGTGLVASLARPGGNVTGVSAATAELAGKSLELVREALPSARRVAVLANEADPLAKPFLEQIDKGARTLGLEVDTTMVRPETPLDAVFDEISSKKAEALIVQGSLQQKELFDLAIKHRLPSFSSNRQVANTAVGTGLVASLARPGGNVTGVSAATAELAGKSLELVREALPSARRVAVLANEADPLAKPFLEQIDKGARTLGLEVDTTMVRPETPLDAVFDEISSKKAEALIVQGS